MRRGRGHCRVRIGTRCAPSRRVAISMESDPKSDDALVRVTVTVSDRVAKAYAAHDPERLSRPEAAAAIVLEWAADLINLEKVIEASRDPVVAAQETGSVAPVIVADGSMAGMKLIPQLPAAAVIFNEQETGLVFTAVDPTGGQSYRVELISFHQRRVRILDSISSR